MPCQEMTEILIIITGKKFLVSAFIFVDFPDVQVIMNLEDLSSLVSFKLYNFPVSIFQLTWTVDSCPWVCLNVLQILEDL